MDTKHLNRILFFTLCLLPFCLLAYLYISSKDIQLMGGSPDKKSIAANNVTLYGWEGPNKSWQIKAKEFWTTKNQDITEFSGVTDGIVFIRKYPVIYGLKADKVDILTFQNKIDASSKNMLEAFIDISAAGTPKDSAAISAKSGYSFLRAKSLTYYTFTKKTDALFFSISNNKYKATAGKLNIDHNQGLASFCEWPKLIATDIGLTATTIESMYEKDEIRGYGNVIIETLKNIPSKISGNTFVYSLKNKIGRAHV